VSTHSPHDIGKEAIEAMREASKETAGQTFARLIRMGLIDTHGQVTKLYGGDAEPEIERADEFLNLEGPGT
jgi:hypothetical protein